MKNYTVHNKQLLFALTGNGLFEFIRGHLERGLRIGLIACLRMPVCT